MAYDTKINGSYEIPMRREANSKVNVDSESVSAECWLKLWFNMAGMREDAATPKHEYCVATYETSIFYTIKSDLAQRFTDKHLHL